MARIGVQTSKTGRLIARRMTGNEKAWLAGLFDGEGSIIFVHPKRVTPTVRIVITSTCYPLLERVVEVTGCGAINDQRVGAKNRNPAHADTWYWSTNSSNAESLLKQMLPWLIVKREKAETMLARRAEARKAR